MNILPLDWVLFCFICGGKSQYLVSPDLPLNWNAAQGDCEHKYNGYLADRDTVIQSTNSLKNCTGGSQFWLGNSLYRTKYITYEGCYNVRNSFESGVIYMEDQSVARCQMHCFYQYGFVIKGSMCQCLPSEYQHGLYNSTSLSKCEFVCLRDDCGFSGGYGSVSIYTTYDPLENAGNPFEDVNCLYYECNVEGRGLQKSICTMQSGISALCVNGIVKEDVESWEKATEFCRQNESYLIEKKVMEHKCGPKYWSNVRRYVVDINSKDNTFDNNGRIGCAFSDSDFEINYSADCYNGFRYYFCVTDDADLLDKSICYIQLLSLSTPDGHQDGSGKITDVSTLSPQNGLQGGASNAKNFFVEMIKIYGSQPLEGSAYSSMTPDPTSDTPRATVTGVVVGLLCCAAVALAVFMIFRIRRKKVLAQQERNKQNQANRSSVHSIQGEDPVFSVSAGTHESSKHPKKESFSSSSGPFYYELDKQISHDLHIDSGRRKHSKTQKSDSFYHTLEMQESSHYDEIVLGPDESNDGPYVIGVENDYDHLHEHREKISGHFPEDEYSKCGRTGNDKNIVQGPKHPEKTT